MTEYRTKGKGKDRIVHPITTRKPYGITRELAASEVQALRAQGKKARLIQTNHRLDLYAPYVSDVKELTVKETVKEPVKEPINKLEVTKRKQRDINNGDRVVLGQDFNILNQKGKVNLNKRDMDEYFSKDSYMKISVDDGELTLLTIDPAHISMIQETMETDLPDGYLDPVVFGQDFTAEWVKSLPPGSSKVRMPPLNYEDDAWTMRLEGKSLTDLLNTLKKNEGNIIQFRLAGDKKDASIEIYSVGVDEDSLNETKEKIETVAATSTRVLEERSTPTGWDMSEKASFSKDYLTTMLRTMMGRGEFQHPKDSVLTMKLKQDYPVLVETRRLGVDGKHIDVKGLIAPRMD